MYYIRYNYMFRLLTMVFGLLAEFIQYTCGTRMKRMYLSNTTLFVGRGM